MWISKQQIALTVAVILSPLLFLNSGCAVTGDTQPIEADGKLLDPRKIESSEEAYKVFAYVVGATQSRMREVSPPSLTVLDPMSMRAFLVLPDWENEDKIHDGGLRIAISRYPVPGVPGEGWPQIGDISQAICPGFVHTIDYWEGVDLDGVYFDEIRTIDSETVATNLALEWFSPESWIGEVVDYEGSSDDQLLPADTWIVWENNFLAMNTAEGAGRLVQFDGTGAMTSLSDFKVPNLLRKEFFDKFVALPNSESFDDYVPDNVQRIDFVYDPPNAVLAGSGAENTNWWVSVVERRRQITPAEKFYEVWGSENLILRGKEMGLEYVFSSFVVRQPDGELFYLVWFSNPETPGEPYTFVTFDFGGNSPAIDAEGQPIVCSTGFDLLSPPGIGSQSEEDEAEQFFTD